MRYELEARSVDLPGTVGLLRVELLKQSILDPEVYVPLPVPLLRRRWEVGDRPLIHLWGGGDNGDHVCHVELLRLMTTQSLS